MRYFPALFLGGFVIELASLIWVGRMVGVIPTILLVLLAGVLGMSVIRRTGLGVGAALRRAGGRGEITSIDAGVVFLRMLAGLLLMIPGFVSDAVALVVLIPPVTAALARTVLKPVDMEVRTGPMGPRGMGPIIEGEAVEIEGTLAPPPDKAEPRP